MIIHKENNLILFSFWILSGIVTGAFFTTHSPFLALALILGIAVLAIFIWKAEALFYIGVLLLVMIEEQAAQQGSIFRYLEDINLSGMPSLLEMSLGLFVISLMINKIIERQRFLPSSHLILITVFFILLTMSAYVGLVNHTNRTVLWVDLKRFSIPALFLICCINILSSWNSEKIQSLLLFIFIAFFIKSCLGVLFYLKGLGYIYGDRQVVFLDTSDHIISVTAMMVLTSLIVHNKLRRWKLLLGLGSLLPILFSFVFSFRRNAWLGFSFSLMLLFMLIPIRRKLKMASLSFGVIFTLILLTTVSNFAGSLPSQNFLLNRMLSISDTKESSNVAHFKEWTTVARELSKNAFWGLGLGSAHSPTGRGINVYTVHNAFLMLWMKMGLLTLLLFCWGLSRYFIFGLRESTTGPGHNLKAIQIGLFSTIGYWIVSLNVGPTWYYYRETCLMALLISIVIAISKIIMRDSKPEESFNLDLSKS